MYGRTAIKFIILAKKEPVQPYVAQFIYPLQKLLYLHNSKYIILADSSVPVCGMDFHGTSPAQPAVKGISLNYPCGGTIIVFALISSLIKLWAHSSFYNYYLQLLMMVNRVIHSPRSEGYGYPR